MDCSPPGSSAHGIFQAGVMEWGAITFYYKTQRKTDRTLSEINHSKIFLDPPVRVMKIKTKISRSGGTHYLVATWPSLEKEKE